jgi:uncharacterized membrane protein YesL
MNIEDQEFVRMGLICLFLAFLGLFLFLDLRMLRKLDRSRSIFSPIHVWNALKMKEFYLALAVLAGLFLIGHALRLVRGGP